MVKRHEAVSIKTECDIQDEVGFGETARIS